MYVNHYFSYASVTFHNSYTTYSMHDLYIVVVIHYLHQLSYQQICRAVLDLGYMNG
jgi:hypothetical protein